MTRMNKVEVKGQGGGRGNDRMEEGGQDDMNEQGRIKRMNKGS